ncbi:U6 snRNA-associated Sm-like protein LSm3, putative [Plasmodium vinckei]|uniref:Small nuclear ribonucleoprotein n=7 Tax=Plasmodium (Vinckeia) TaxID=418101 RepID=W7ABM1_PLAVN|nr:U6 snRNA-associated Sm-like protein LSm3, putative [Plasmodium vinckei vinckei]XP_016653627.1 U6 snRNA-associated Sm-like protein LSm3, putative [Plasmodium chabaudi chabaudi]EUD70622.1 small nuclear ribonucleoprotein [Plasmodium vinckei petteri]CAD2089022.1 U6 snRNA-associated Sm-like protein LSm3, putative [Plasmodium vinckei brucechwatti]CAD2089253.1 U6 snRNA-associated Sm-like protein LSm3, putative [Plasmodium vinckei lentum]CAD2101476.1 U6 snRNA-associated Sm-like protein LSm3, putati|eukprot:XP_016653627.1 U6 snRNA-associated Sm-like protein LSm3, putative [Plasmodium chabaudi chabaudi]
MEKIALIQSPLDYIRLNMEEEIFLKCKGDRELTGTLDAYDNHLNMVLSNAKEKYKQVTIENNEECVKQIERNLDMVFVRGDSIILVSSAAK